MSRHIVARKLPGQVSGREYYNLGDLQSINQQLRGIRVSDVFLPDHFNLQRKQRFQLRLKYVVIALQGTNDANRSSRYRGPHNIIVKSAR